MIAVGATKLDRRQRRSKAAFREAFRQLVSKKDISKITVKEITELADRDRKTFYLHYESIDDLIDEIIQEEIRGIVEALGDDSLEDEGRVDVEKLFDVLSHELVSSFNQTASILKHVDTDRLVRRLCPILTQEIINRDSLELARTLGPYLKPFVAYFCSGLLGLYHQWAFSEAEISQERLAKLVGATTAGGISALTVAACSDELMGGAS